MSLEHMLRDEAELIGLYLQEERFDTMTTLAEISAQLSEPFALDDIDFLPKGKPIERDGKTLMMGFPFADPRVYQDRLNAIAYGEWSTPAPVVIVAGNKLICYVTVILCGVPHTDVGEANNNEENTGTEAFAQAFKRACSQFGLGRYLYDLEKQWIPYNVQRKQIDLDKAGKAAIVKKMYQKAGIGVKPTIAVVPPQPHDEPVIENLKQVINSVRNRAYKLGLFKTVGDYERYCHNLIGKPAPETLADVNALNADMAAREKKAS